MKKKLFLSCKNEEGFVLVMALVILFVLSLVGISSMDTSTLEKDIAANERFSSEIFKMADSGWLQAVPFLDMAASAPEFINQSIGFGADRVVRNYGNGVDGTTNNAFPVTPGSPTHETSDGSLRGGVMQKDLQYWYRVIYTDDISAPSFGTDYRRFFYNADSHATGYSGETDIAVSMSRVFKVGY